MRTAVVTDQRPVRASTRRNELIHRLLAGRCAVCESPVNLQVHHIRKLADLSKPGRRDKPAWMHLMAMRWRKSLVVCRCCHEDIRAGRPTAPTKNRRRAAYEKLSRIVRERTAEQGPHRGDLAGARLHLKGGWGNRTAAGAGAPDYQWKP